MFSFLFKCVLRVYFGNSEELSVYFSRQYITCSICLQCLSKVKYFSFHSVSWFEETLGKCCSFSSAILFLSWPTAFVLYWWWRLGPWPEVSGGEGRGGGYLSTNSIVSGGLPPLAMSRVCGWPPSFFYVWIFLGPPPPSYPGWVNVSLCPIAKFKQPFIWMSTSCLGRRDNSGGRLVSPRQVG